MHALDLFHRHPLHDAAASRRLEQQAQSQSPDADLMQRAGLASARLALALAPHARRIWIACGPGHNGGDGLEAALQLHRWGRAVHVSLLMPPERLPQAVRAACQRAQEGGVPLSSQPPTQWDLAIDALLGLGGSRAPAGTMRSWVAQFKAAPAPVLALDLPTGLHPDTGMPLDHDASSAGSGPEWDAGLVRARWTLALLSLKPGLFTGLGRDVSGQIWLDRLGVAPLEQAPSAWLNGEPAPNPRPHYSHKGLWGDVVVIGGTAGMQGAALLAARSALAGGAGRVYLGLMAAEPTGFAVEAAELMWRHPDTLDLNQASVVCGCGAGPAIADRLPRILATARELVLDADALNAVADDPRLMTRLRARAARQRITVLTPHPLEAARLLGCSTAQVQAHRLQAAQQLAEQSACIVVLKGSGTVIAAPGHCPRINPTGNGRLATAGTGDVLAGLLGAELARAGPARLDPQGLPCSGAPAATAASSPPSCMALGIERVSAAVWRHGRRAEVWPGQQPLTATALATAWP